ncbi:MAG: carbonic anhydrase [Candidatus Eremiobacteraeota bacterium]|nr:carbonic anhydrase [Candidatus Eremiobacteraeota bacterium]
MTYDRRRFLTTSALGLGAIADSGFSAEAAVAEPRNSREAMQKLLEGNARFVADRTECVPLSARRIELASGQSPFAIVLGCSDSRVPVETVFDQVPGSIFAVRIAGNFVDDSALGSIEYSVSVLKSMLILVLGHRNCGAVKAAVAYVKSGEVQAGHIQTLVNAVAPAARSTKSMSGDWIENATVRNVQDNIGMLTSRSSIITSAVESGSLSIAGGVYDLHSGRVDILR